jgi:hypothetical protein
VMGMCGVWCLPIREPVSPTVMMSGVSAVISASSLVMPRTLDHLLATGGKGGGFAQSLRSIAQGGGILPPAQAFATLSR